MYLFKQAFRCFECWGGDGGSRGVRVFEEEVSIFDSRDRFYCLIPGFEVLYDGGSK